LEVEDKYRMIDTLSGELSDSYLKLQQATDARMAKQLVLTRGASQDSRFQDLGIEMSEITPSERGDIVGRENTTLVAARTPRMTTDDREAAQS